MNVFRYDLSLVSNMSKLPVELRRLIATRQRAKLRVEAEGGRRDNSTTAFTLSISHNIKLC